MSLLQMPGGRASARCVWSPCLGRQNDIHKKMRDGRSVSIRWHNNQRSDGVGGGKFIGEEMWTSGTRGGGRLLVVLGDKMSNEKNGNRVGDGAMSFDGFCWMK